MRTAKASERGDTLIEVLLAMAILSAVIVGALVMMGRGQALGQDSLERSQVTAFMTDQSEILQYIRDGYDLAATDTEYPAKLWGPILARLGTANPDGCSSNGKGFYFKKDYSATNNEVTLEPFDASTINEGSANFVSTYAQPGDGLWIEAEKATSSNYIDFYIKACWRTVSGDIKQEAITIERLYVPPAK